MRCVTSIVSTFEWSTNGSHIKIQKQKKNWFYNFCLLPYLNIWLPFVAFTYNLCPNLTVVSCVFVGFTSYSIYARRRKISHSRSALVSLEQFQPLILLIHSQLSDKNI